MSRNYHNGMVIIGPRILIAQTCRACGLFKGADAYKKTRGIYWHSICAMCRQIAVKKVDLEVNHASWDHATNAGKRWTLADIQKLDELTEQGLTIKELSVAMGRSTAGIMVAKSRYLEKSDGNA